MANKIEQNNAQKNETLNKSEAFFLKYKKEIIGGVIAVVAIIAIWAVLQTFVFGPRGENQKYEMSKAQAFFNSDMMTQAVMGDSTNTKGFAQLAEDLSGENANLANLYAGLAMAQEGKWEDAVKYLEKFNDCGDQMVSPAAEAALGNAYAHLNKLEEAVKHLKHAAERADNNSLSPTFLIQAGEILENQGKKEEALELYKQVKEKYFQSVSAKTIDAYIERASTK